MVNSKATRLARALRADALRPKRPEWMPMIAAEIKKVRVKKNGFDRYGSYWGFEVTGAPVSVYSYELRYAHKPSDRFAVEHVFAASKAKAKKKIKATCYYVTKVV